MPTEPNGTLPLDLVESAIRPPGADYHLVRTGVDINTIRTWLGHVSLETTNRYAEVDLEMKAKALATCAIIDGPGVEHAKQPARGRHDVLGFLASL